MRNTSNVEGTKIAEAAQELDVTSVTIRRYLAEFNIETQTDKNGIKILPKQAMDELREVRRLKDQEGFNNAKVLEMLEQYRRSGQSKELITTLANTQKPSKKTKVAKLNEIQADTLQLESIEFAPITVTDDNLAAIQTVVEFNENNGDEDTKLPVNDNLNDLDNNVAENGSLTEDNLGKPRHTLTCQTCGKGFEHSNPKLRDCLDCYRVKRKERRKTGQDKQRSVIAHPLVNKVISKSNNLQEKNPDTLDNIERTNDLESSIMPEPDNIIEVNQLSAVQNSKPRSYKRAIEETRQITGSIKRRLERPDLPESERRWLEQIYAYQLILHQGWKHLSDYKNESKDYERMENS